MPSIRSRFTYLWLIIVACCVVTRPAIAAPITARVVTIPCKIDGEVVNKQILLIGVLHKGGQNDDQCFTNLSNIINKFIKEHKDKTISPIPVLLEAPGYQSVYKGAFPVEHQLATKYIKENGTSPFCFIQADVREEEVLQLVNWFETILKGGVNSVKKKQCGSLGFYKNLRDKVLRGLIQSLDDLEKLGLPAQRHRNEINRQMRQVASGHPATSNGPFSKLHAEFLKAEYVLDRSLSMMADTTNICDVLVNRTTESYVLDLFLKSYLANAGFFSELVKRLPGHNKLICFCGDGHIDGIAGGELTGLFRDFGCTVEDIELHQTSDNQKYISPSKLQEIFTNFLDCCQNTKMFR